MSRVYFLLLLMTQLGALAGFFLKKTSSTRTLKELLCCKHLYGGAILYLASAIINIYVLRYLAYSVVLPLTSITYVWTMILARTFLGEKISYRKRIGVLLILIGSFAIGHASK